MRLIFTFSLCLFTAFVSTLSHAQQLYIEENFEDDLSLPIVFGGEESNYWTVSEPIGEDFSQAYSPSNAMLSTTAAHYETDNWSYFDIVLDAENDPDFPGWLGWGVWINFWHKIDSEVGVDGGYITFSYDDGETWLNAFEEDPYSCEDGWSDPSLFYQETDLLFNGEPGFSGTSDDWMYAEYVKIWLLPAKTNYDSEPPLKMIIRFNFISDSNETFQEGWMIDDLALTFEFSSGISDQPHTNDLLYPNPTIGSYTILNVRNMYCDDCLVQLYHTSGKMVEQFNTSEQEEVTISTHDLVAGTYVLQLLTKDGQLLYTDKLVHLK